MDRDDIIAAVARLEAVADRFEATVTKVDDHATRLASLEASRGITRKVVGWIAGIAGPLIVGVALYFLIGKGHP